MKIEELINPIIFREPCMLNLTCREFIESIDPLAAIRQVDAEEAASFDGVEIGHFALELPMHQMTFYNEVIDESIWVKAASKLLLRGIHLDEYTSSI